MTLTRVLQKNDANAWLKAVVNGLALDLVDTAAAGPTDSECPWAVSAVASDPCSASMVADVGSSWMPGIRCRTAGSSLRHVDSSVRLHGWRNHWAVDLGSSPDSDEPIADKDLELDIDFVSDDSPNSAGPERDPHTAATRSIQGPLPTVVDIPLDTVKTSGQFNLQITLTTFALTRRQSESYAGAFVRDPTHASNVQFVEQGIEVVRAPASQAPPKPPSPSAPLPAPACTTGIDPAAGVIQFEKSSIDGLSKSVRQLSFALRAAAEAREPSASSFLLAMVAHEQVSTTRPLRPSFDSKPRAGCATDHDPAGRQRFSRW